MACMQTAPQPRISLTLILPIALVAALAAGAPAAAEWHLRFEPMSMDASGHDPDVLTVRDGAGARQVSLDTESGPAYRAEYRHRRDGRWGWGVDFLWFTAEQAASERASASVPGAPARFEIAGGGFTSTGPGEVLFYDRLEDTDMNLWTADLYATRALTDRLTLHLGVRNADFDNDYRAAVGLEGVAGTRIDASSNYGRMIGPLVGVEGTFERGRHRVDAYLGQSVVFGTAELSSQQRDFLGAFSAEPDPPFFAERVFSQKEDVTIPITDLRLRWTYRLFEHLGLGLGVNGSLWTDVPVPPGADPAGTFDTRAESTIALVGAFAAIEVRF